MATQTIQMKTILSEERFGLPILVGDGPTAWKIRVDWARSGSFTDPYDDITDRVTSATWFLGARKPYQESGDDSMLMLVVDNTDRRYSPENSSSPLAGLVKPFKRIQIESSDGLTNVVHWVGWIESIEPSVNVNGSREVKIVAAGPMQFFKAAETQIELQENQRTDLIIAQLVEEVVIPPSLNSAWILGRRGNSDLSVTTFLADTTCYQSLEPGITILAIAGDNWVTRGGSASKTEDTFNVYRAITDVAAAERGRFFFDRTGKAIFWNRQHLLKEVPDAAAFNDEMTNMSYKYAGLDFKNEIVVMCHPRAISSSLSDLLWVLENEMTIGVGEIRTIYAKYDDGSGNRIGAKNVAVQNAVLSQGSATIFPTYAANSAELIISNDGAVDAVLTHLELQGQKITDFGVMEASVTDAASVMDYGRRTFKLNIAAVDKFDDARGIALFELHRRSQPRGVVESLTLTGQASTGKQQSFQRLLSIGDRVAIQESQTQHADSYYIMGEEHHLTQGGILLETTWYLEPIPLEYPWKLGDMVYSILGTTTGLTY